MFLETEELKPNEKEFYSTNIPMVLYTALKRHKNKRHFLTFKSKILSLGIERIVNDFVRDSVTKKAAKYNEDDSKDKLTEEYISKLKSQNKAAFTDIVSGIVNFDFEKSLQEIKTKYKIDSDGDDEVDQDNNE